MRLLKKIIAITFILVVYCASSYGDDNEGTGNREYPIVAAYIYNFTQFTTWPQTAPADRFTLCVLGSNPFGELLTPLKSKTARGSNFTLRYITGTIGPSSGCDVLFITPTETSHIKGIIAALSNSPILTISNIEGFAESGGMVELYKEDTKIGIRVNNQAVQGAGLTVSSKLLSLAHIVSSQ